MLHLLNKLLKLEERLKDMTLNAFDKVVFGIRWSVKDIEELESYINTIKSDGVRVKMLDLLERVKSYDVRKQD